MIVTLSELEKFIAGLPLYWQMLALNAIIEETKRWEKGEYTEEEKRLLEICKKVGEESANHLDRIYKLAFNYDNKTTD